MSKQVALVTGGSRGIGLAAAEALAKRGTAIALNALSGDPSLGDAVSRLQEFGAQVFPLPFDVTDLSAHGTALSQAEEALGPLTTLVNNAGIGAMRRGDPLEVSEESWDRCLAVNSKAPFFLTQAFARRLLERGRDEQAFYAVVNVTSSNARAVAVPRVEYCVSKAAAAMVSQAWAVRLGSEGIAVYDVQPGLIETDMTAPVIESYAERAREGLTVLPRVGQPAEVGEIIAQLALGGLPYTTGQVISADGGMLIPRF